MNFSEIFQLDNIRSEFRMRDNYLYFISSERDRYLEKINLDGPSQRSVLLNSVSAFRIMDEQIMVNSNDNEALNIYNIESERIIAEIQNINVLLAVFIDKCRILYQKSDEDRIYIRDICNGSDDFLMRGKFDYFST